MDTGPVLFVPCNDSSTNVVLVAIPKRGALKQHTERHKSAQDLVRRST